MYKTVSQIEEEELMNGRKRRPGRALALMISAILMVSNMGPAVYADEQIPELSDAGFYEETVETGMEESAQVDEILREDEDQSTEIDMQSGDDVIEERIGQYTENGAGESAEQQGDDGSTGELVDENQPAEEVLGAIPDESKINTWVKLQAAFDAGGEVTLTQDITAEASDNALVVPSSKTVILDLTGHTIDRGLTTPTPDGYVIQNEGTLTITDSSADQSGKITGGYNDEYEDEGVIPFGHNRGGGIYNNGTLTLDGGSITGNKAKDNAGVLNNGTFTMNGGAISNNTSYKLGGAGVTNYFGGRFTMTGGTISGNSAVTRGGGVWSMNPFTMTGGTISGNTAGNNGGGVCVRYGTATISGGIITGNSATGATAGDENTTVTGCGGGLYIDQGGDVTFSGGSIVGNTAQNVGGDVYLNRDESWNPSLNMYGSPETGDLYLAEGKVITVTGAFTDDAFIYVSTAAGTGVFTSGYGANNGEVHPSCYFCAFDASNGVFPSDGEAALGVGVVNNVSYMERSWNGTEVVTETKTRDAVAIPNSGNMTSGWYYLNRNVTVKKLVSFTGDTNLILGDGFTLNVKGLYIPQGSTLTIYAQSDGNNAGKIKSVPDSGAAIGATSDNHPGGNIIIHGGTIEATGHDHCAGIGSNDGNGTAAPITIYGGTITAKGGSDGAGIGGGRECDGGEITIYGGEVTAKGGGNNGAGIGGGQKGSGGTIAIYGGNVTANGSTDSDCSENGAGIGGGDSADGGTITINGGTITAYSRDGAGIGGGDDGDGGTITINGGTVTSVKVNQGQGARIGGGCDAAPGTIVINGGSITTTGGSGAGIGGGKGNKDGGKVTINGGVIEATGSYGIGKGAEGSDVEITLDYTSTTLDTIRITAGIHTDTINLKKSFKSTDGNETYSRGNYTGDEAEALSRRMDGKTLVSLAEYEIQIIVPSDKHGKVTASAKFAIEGTTITLTPVGNPGYVLAPVDGIIVNRIDTFERIDVSDDYTFIMPACDVMVFANFIYRGTEQYLGLDGEMHDASVSYITDDVLEWKADTWYAVTKDTVITQQVSLGGAGVNLILCDGATLTTKEGIKVNENQGLTIWAQSDAKSNDDAGKLIADCSSLGGTAYPGIGGCGQGASGQIKYSGDITINGGKIIAKGARYAAGIGGSMFYNAGRVTINGGVIDATSGDHAVAIGNGYLGLAGAVFINGGTVVARDLGGLSYGIGGQEDSQCSVRIALSDPDDSVTVSSYHQCRLTLAGNYVDQDGTSYPDGTEYSFGDEIGLSNKTLKLAVYTVTFDRGHEDVTGTMDTVPVVSGGVYTLPDCVFTAPDGM